MCRVATRCVKRLAGVPLASRASDRLPNTLLLGGSSSDPGWLFLFLFPVFLSVISIYYVTFLVFEVSTIIGVLLGYSAIIWTAGAALASAIVFPGASRNTSRTFERLAAVELRARIDRFARDCETASSGQVLSLHEVVLKWV